MEKECNPCQKPPRWEEFWQMARQLVEHRSDAVAPLDVFTNDASPPAEGRGPPFYNGKFLLCAAPLPIDENRRIL